MRPWVAAGSSTLFIAHLHNSWGWKIQAPHSHMVEVYLSEPRQWRGKELHR